jgi:simple sugar transport system ATP-binding protein
MEKLQVRARSALQPIGELSGGNQQKVAIGRLLHSDSQILLEGRVVPPGRPDVALRRGVGYVPEDRHDRGYVPLLGVADNITMTINDRLTRYGVLAPARHRTAARGLADRLDVVSAGTGQPVGELSGGNQQKVVVGRALAREPKVVVAVAPTQGVDVASKRSLLGALEDARNRGAGVLLVSDDLADLAIANRIVVLVRCSVFAQFTDPPWDRERLIAAAEGLAGAATSSTVDNQDGRQAGTEGEPQQ